MCVHVAQCSLHAPVSQVIPWMWSHERGPMGGTPYIRLEQVGGPTFEVVILCASNNTHVTLKQQSGANSA